MMTRVYRTKSRLYALVALAFVIQIGLLTSPTFSNPADDDHDRRDSPLVYPDGFPTIGKDQVFYFGLEDIAEYQLPFGADYPGGNPRIITQTGNGDDSHACPTDTRRTCGAYDFDMPEEPAPIYAVYFGTVITATQDSGFGKYIIIAHDGSSTYSLYAHLSQQTISAGGRVARGQIIGFSGSTGISSGTHLHFGITLRAYDPIIHDYVFLPVNLQHYPGIRWLNDTFAECASITPPFCGTARGIPEFFNGINYTGIMSQAIGFTQRDLRTTWIGNDDINSLRVPQGYSVRLREHILDQTGGWQINFEGGTQVENLGDNNNEASAIVVTPPCLSNCPPPSANLVLCVATTAVATTAPCLNAVAYTSIQQAVDAANNGTEIRVAQGIYRNTQIGATTDPVVTLDKNVTLAGGYSTSDWSTQGDYSLTTIDGQTAPNAISVQGSVGPAVQNLSVSGGIANPNGTVNVWDNTLYLYGGTANGRYNLYSGTEARIDGNVADGANFGGLGYLTGNPTFNGSATIGRMALSSGFLNVTGNMTVQNFDMSGGKIGGTGNLTIARTMNWTGGSMVGTGATTVASGATLNISGPEGKRLTQRTLNNAGTTNWTSAGSIIYADSNATINNSGLFDAQDDSYFSCCFYSPYNFTFNNSGTFRKSGSSGSYTYFHYNSTFNNTGSVQVLTGTVYFDGSFTQYNGTLSLLGGTVSRSGTLDILGGSVDGTGIINGSISNYGTISPGASPGSLTINGNLWQAPTATLNIEIGGLNPGSQHDQLIVNGTATLDGALNITTTNGYTPNISDTFQILNYTSHNGSFATVNGLDLPNARVYTPAYNPANLTLTVAQTAALVGHVTWQGRPPQPHALQQLPVTLTLKLGATEVNYPALTTDPSGYFTVSVGSVPTGTYQWRVDGPKYLANAGTVALTGSLITSAEMGQMRAGDANDDNIVSVQDFNILKLAFGRQVGDPGYDDRADFTGDQVVSITDFNWLKLNFGLPGAPPLGSGGP